MGEQRAAKGISPGIEAWASKRCLCGHAFGSHGIFSGCMVCECPGAYERPPVDLDYQKGDFTGVTP